MWFVDCWFYYICSILVYYCVYPFILGFIIVVLFHFWGGDVCPNVCLESPSKSKKHQRSQQDADAKSWRIPWFLGWHAHSEHASCGQSFVWKQHHRILFFSWISFLDFAFLGCFWGCIIPIRRHISIIGFLVTSNYVTIFWYLKHDRPPKKTGARARRWRRWRRLQTCVLDEKWPKRKPPFSVGILPMTISTTQKKIMMVVL